MLAVGEDPDNLVVYAALGRAARDWPSHDKIVETLKTMETGETLHRAVRQADRRIRTHAEAPIVIMANCNIVGQWAKAEKLLRAGGEEPDLLGRSHRRRLAIYRLAGRHSGHL